jgi:hypothetical protein
VTPSSRYIFFSDTRRRRNVFESVILDTDSDSDMPPLRCTVSHITTVALKQWGQTLVPLTGARSCYGYDPSINGYIPRVGKYSIHTLGG